MQSELKCPFKVGDIVTPEAVNEPFPCMVMHVEEVEEVVDEWRITVQWEPGKRSGIRRPTRTETFYWPGAKGESIRFFDNPNNAVVGLDAPGDGDTQAHGIFERPADTGNLPRINSTDELDIGFAAPYGKPPEIRLRTGSRWIDQTTFYDPARPGQGNCTEACVASLLNIPLGCVPRFWPHADQLCVLGEVFEFWENFRTFFGERGWEVFDEPSGFEPDCIVMMVGPSARGCNHMVLAEKGQIIHDPHPSKAGLLRVEHVYYIAPLDPGMWNPRRTPT